MFNITIHCPLQNSKIFFVCKMSFKSATIMNIMKMSPRAAQRCTLKNTFQILNLTVP